MDQQAMLNEEFELGFEEGSDSVFNWVLREINEYARSNGIDLKDMVEVLTEKYLIVEKESS